MKILVVDDDALARKGIKKCISGCIPDVEDIFLACDGQEALKIIETQDINIVISDIKMPRMDGVQLAKYIHQSKPYIKVILLSAYADFEYARSGIKYGVKEYLLKPISYENVATITGIIKETYNELVCNKKGMLKKRIFMITKIR